MDRTPQQQTGRSRRFTTGVTLLTVALVATTVASSASSRAGVQTFPHAAGVVGILGIDETDADNPFFQELGTNGRTCATCHRPAQGWTIAPAELRDRFDRTEGLDPVFRANDGSTCQ